MTFLRAPLALLLAVAAAPADAGPEAIYGTWGSAAQCIGAPSIAGGTRRAAPVEISESWLRQGEIWCRLDWFDTGAAGVSRGYFAARALCGEDAARDHALGAHFDGSTLTLIWNQEWIDGPLQRCPPSD